MRTCVFGVWCLVAVVCLPGGAGSLSEEEIDHLGITNPKKLSAASKRALKWPKVGNEWFGEFQIFDLKGDLAYADFDGPFKEDGHKDNLVKTWEPHMGDWRSGDPSWQDGKGKGLIGAIILFPQQILTCVGDLYMLSVHFDMSEGIRNQESGGANGGISSA